jgi:hydrogenase small subunit
MLTPSRYAWADTESLGQHLKERGVSRRDFLKFCSEMAVILGVGSTAAPRVAKALQSLKRPSVIWLQLQECTGCVESVLRTAEPTIGDLGLDVVSLDYQHTLMAGAGEAVEKAKQAAMPPNQGQYLLLVTGSIPTKENGIYTTIGGRTAKDVLEEAAAGAAAILALGACAHW